MHGVPSAAWSHVSSVSIHKSANKYTRIKNNKQSKITILTDMLQIDAVFGNDYMEGVDNPSMLFDGTIFVGSI